MTEETEQPARRGVAPRSSLRLEPVRDEIRSRKRKGGQSVDKFHIDASQIPSGSSYEWKTVTVYGKEDPSYNVLLREQGWEPVDSSRHPGLVADGHTGPIIRDGLMLMERPIELTQEAMAEDRANATEMVTIKKQQILGETPAGTMSREASNLKNYARTSYEALPIDN
ncbi:hypothetical protein FHT87_005167 [Rhizobium sp. BK316]|uniref:hypothetical protein n=1 Tax=Rhizobium sp. BK316 TaxID=2587053 RepID=UPI001610E0FB|nr:hypothetical protein [Rhizobium sp. BK316]MBB3411214.1 hypothetical protein [Rhizobium sp. BK316]